MEPFSYASTAYVVASALVSVQLFCKNLDNLQKFFGQMVYPPLAKIARTPMIELVECTNNLLKQRLYSFLLASNFSIC